MADDKGNKQWSGPIFYPIPQPPADIPKEAREAWLAGYKEGRAAQVNWEGIICERHPWHVWPEGDPGCGGPGMPLPNVEDYVHVYEAVP